MVGTTWVESEDHLRELVAGGAFTTRTVAAGMEAAGFDRALDEASGGLLIESALDVEVEYHCEVLRWKGTEVYALPARYCAPLLRAQHVGSVMLPLVTEEAGNVVGLARKAADALQLSTGFAHVEIMRTREGRWWLGELGLRPGGGGVCTLVGLQHPGVDVHGLQADLAMSIPPEVHLSPDRPPVAWVGSLAPRGVIVDITPCEDILRYPGVIAAEPALAVGDEAFGPMGTANYAGHVFAAGATAEEAASRAAAAASAWQFRTLAAPDLSLRH